MKIDKKTEDDFNETFAFNKSDAVADNDIVAPSGSNAVDFSDVWVFIFIFFVFIGAFSVLIFQVYYFVVPFNAELKVDQPFNWIGHVLGFLISFFVCYFSIYAVLENFLVKLSLNPSFVVAFILLSFVFLFGFFLNKDVMRFLSIEEKSIVYERLYKKEKKEIEDKYESEIRQAQALVRIAEIDIKRRDLLKNERIDYNTQVTSLELAQDQLKALQSRGVDYGSLNYPRPQTSNQNDDKSKLILSGLWLGVCFFLQRLFEKVFHDKGYALLAVCAAGFLIAFFSANYFLLGGSVTGGLIGATGSRS